MMKALVTGASEGIGGAVCRGLAAQAAASGDTLSITLHTSGRKGPPQALRDELVAGGAEVQYLGGNLADADFCAELAESALNFSGGMDLFVSNAGGVAPGRFVDTSVESWDQQFALNTRPTFIIGCALHAALVESRGSVVAVASMSGMQAHRGHAAYSPAKAALISLCQNLAQEWAADGIRVNCVSPGMVRTPLTAGLYAHDDVTRQREAMIPLGRIGAPEEIAEVVLFLAGDASRYMTGQNLLVDGGICDSLLGSIPGLPKD
jgi:NAD(P)-dependent dehydrogenase (short-subunit alcohol dehydrogenase family)